MTIKNLLYTGAILAGLASLVGCNNPNPSTNSDPVKGKYFAEIPMNYQGGMAMVSGDFDKDGDIDVIAGLCYGSAARLYFFENDGKGNFTIKEPSKVSIKPDELITPLKP
jgi:hypothetical protein